MNNNEILTFREQFFDLVNKSKSILITSHVNPDDDSISSVLTLKYVLQKIHTIDSVEIVYSSMGSNRWTYFGGFNEIKFGIDITESIHKYDLIIVLDGSQYSRFTNFPEKLESYLEKIICIDHHASPVDTFALQFIDPKKTSVAEILFDIFLEPLESIPTRLAEVNLLGILGDTGTFRFVRPDQVSVFDAVKRLQADGNIDIQRLKAQYERYSEKTFALVKLFVNNASIKSVNGWPKFMTSYIKRGDTQGYEYSEVSEAAHIFVQTFGLSIEGVNWACVAYPSTSGDIKLSCRSLPGSVNVRLIGERMGNGGGHDRAGGATLENTKEFEISKGLEILEKWMKDNEVIVS